MSSNLTLKVHNLSKCYRLFERPLDRLRQLVSRNDKQYYKEFWALKNISFQVDRGQTLGIIGRNGAGKSTLLKLICGVLSPTSGEVEIAGKIAALLELGSGFNPEFTGRENIVMSAAVYGLKKAEIDGIVDAIIAFSEVGEFIDRPVKMYSSGMFVRLAFSVITHVRADILIIDEALSVGDIKFQQKCNRFLEEFKANGGSIIFVSHDITMVKSISDTVVYLKRDNDSALGDFLIGDPEEISRKYIEDLYIENSSQSISVGNPNNPPHVNESVNLGLISPRKSFSSFVESSPLVALSTFETSSGRFGNGTGKIVSAEFLSDKGMPLAHFNLGDMVCIKVLLRAIKNIKAPTLALIIKDRTGNYLFSDGTAGNFDDDLSLLAGESVEVKYSFRFPYLISGEYTLDISFADGDIMEHEQVDWLMDCFVISVSQGRNVVGQVGFSDYKVHWDIYPAN